MGTGRKVKEIIDRNRTETLNKSREYRRFMISVWYPTEVSTHSSASYKDLFHPCEDEVIKTLIHMGAREENMNQLRLNVTDNAPLPDGDRSDSLPVILYSPGIGIDRDMYTYNILNLVNEGYVVVTIGTTYDAIFSVFPNGEYAAQSETVQQKTADKNYNTLNDLIDIRVEDIKRSLDELTDMNKEFFNYKLDLDRIGVIGHSLGGASIFEVARVDKRIKAGILFDASLHLISHDSEVETPFLSLRQQASSLEEMKESWRVEVAKAYSNGQEKLFQTLTGPKYFIKVSEADHMSFSDVPSLFTPKIEQDRVKLVHDVFNTLTISFCNQFIKEGCEDFNQLIKSEKKGFEHLNHKGEVDQCIGS